MKTFAMLLALTLAITAAAFGQSSPWSAVESVLGRKGAEQGGVYKVAYPRTDLKVAKAGVPVPPGVALTSWMSFVRNEDHAMVMGDLVLLEQEVAPVMAALSSQGFEVTALHNHLLGTTPYVLYLHYSGQGDPAKLAEILRSTLTQTGTPMGEPKASPTGAGPDWTQVEAILGRAGQKKGGLIQFGVPRQETIRDVGMDVPPAMGAATVINMEMVLGKAEASGDYVLLADEVNPVVKALLKNGIEVTAIHGHMLRESPRLFFLHFWGFDDPAKLAQGLRAALDVTNSKK